MRRMVVVLSVLVAAFAADARVTPRRRVEADRPASAFECDTARGVRAFGSSGRCLRALCVDRNLVNAYVLDARHRLQRNPCAGLDPFELGR